MKLTTLILFIALLQVNAKGYSQITLKVSNAPLTKILKAIEKQTDYVFLYNENQLQSEFVSLNVKNVSVNDVLTKCLNGTGIGFQIIDKNITLKKQKTREPSFQQKKNITISGKVTDTLGRPVPGISVVYNARQSAPSSATSKIAVTNANGEYVLTDIPEDGRLSFSGIGYVQQLVNVNSRSVINVVLKQEV
ncbi:secretin and TonB N-terminal domain-containing protein, partial [Pedobacter sp.]|uniref:secretin and TonB N-terminal domain-containing protein n=1 Tax=Pedobacter sp. TaxID=1411316 RepID=UPI003D7F22C1